MRTARAMTVAPELPQWGKLHAGNNLDLKGYGRFPAVPVFRLRTGMIIGFHWGYFAELLRIENHGIYRVLHLRDCPTYGREPGREYDITRRSQTLIAACLAPKGGLK